MMLYWDAKNPNKTCISDFCCLSAVYFSLTCLMCVGELVMMVVEGM